jgi:hypothetical protein
MEVEFLVKTQKKLDLFVSLLKEVENAKADIDNDYHLLPSSVRSTFSFQPIVASFFQICHFILHGEYYHIKAIELLRKKITDRLSTVCNHQFIEDDIECNMENVHISYCVLCEIKK